MDGTPAGPVFILGMHRSGTSLVARVTNLLGISLGDPAGMLAPGYDNPRGFWEQRAVMDLNDSVLAALGGAVWSPPELPAGWETRPELARLEAEARELIQREFGGGLRWGIKDPRASLTLPFWARVAGEPACIVCVRAPMDVAASLLRREPHLHTLDSVTLAWTRYTSAALANTNGRPRILAFYEDFVADPRGETDRLARFLGIDPVGIGEDVRGQIEDFVDPELTHHASAVADIADSDAIPLVARHLYLALRAARLSEGTAPDLAEAVTATSARVVERLSELQARASEAASAAAEAQAALREASRAAAESAREAFEWRARAEGLANARGRALLPRLLGRTEVSPPRLIGEVELPDVGAAVARDSVRVSGWAVMDPGPVVRGELLVDGRPVGQLSLGLPRPDLAANGRPADAAASGFEGYVPAAALPGDSGSVQLAVRFEDASGAAATLAPDRPVELEPQAEGWIDLPTGSVRRDQFLVAGWALFTPGVTARVEVIVNGTGMGSARLGLPRPDVARSHPANPNAEMAGFELHVPPTRLPPDAGTVTVTARAVALDGRELELVAPGRVRLEPDLEPLIDPHGRGARLRARVPKPRSRGSRDGRPRLLAATHSLQEGGAQRYLFEQLVRLQRDHGFDPTVLAPGPGVYRERFEAAGIGVHVDRRWPGNDIDAYEDAVLDLAHWAAPREFDLVLVNTLLPFIGGDLASRLDLPFAWAIHDSFDLSVWWIKAHGGDRGFGSSYVRSRAESAMRSAALMLFPSAATRELYTPYVDPERALVVPTAIEVEGLAAVRSGRGDPSLRERLGWGPDDFMVLCLAIVDEPRKGQASLAQAMSAIREDHPSARLALVGDTPTEYSAGLHRLVERSGVGDIVHFEPVTDAPYDWLLAADLLVLASDVEALPMSILEAMVLGTPVLATGVFGVPEVIEEGRTGWMCVPNDVGALAAALSRVLALPAADRSRVAERARAHVEEHYSAERYANGLARLLRELVAAGR